MIWMVAPHRASRACFTGRVDPTGPVAAGVEWEWGRGGEGGAGGGCPQGSMLSLSAAATQIHSLSSSPQLGNSLKRSLDYSV